MVKNKKNIILGIDPGFAIVGYGIVEKDCSGNLKVIDYGTINTQAKLPFARRIKDIYDGLEKVIKKYKPNIMAVEELFFSKNIKTAIEVGQARGVIILTGIRASLFIEEYTPLQIKQAVTSYGRAEKNQVQQMVKMILNLKVIPRPDDAADALAIAICCGNSSKYLK